MRIIYWQAEEMSMPNDTAVQHSFLIDKDNNITMSGVKDIVSLTDSEAIISTDKGRLVLKGKELSLATLDKDSGKLTMNSQGVTNIVYSGVKKPFSLKNLFS